MTIDTAIMPERRLRLVPAYVLTCVLLLAGCGPSPQPLVFRNNPQVIGPWCAPNQRTKIGERVVGRVQGGNKWQDFLVDHEGREYDPFKLGESTWAYLERCGEAKKIDQEYAKDGYLPIRALVSVKPMVVILVPNWNRELRKQIGPTLPRYHCTTFDLVYRQTPPFHPEMQWFSPDLKQKPKRLIFDENGIAEIPLTTGKIRIVRENDTCTITRLP